jgi:hypothetical protein
MRYPKTALAFFACFFLLGCDDVTLGEAMDDLNAAMPEVCEDFCAAAAECGWNDMGFEPEGLYLDAVRRDWEKGCAVACAYRLDSGAYVYESEWDDIDQIHRINFTEKISARNWRAYFKCLGENQLWQCGQWGNMEVRAQDNASCTALDECVQLLDIAQQYSWDPGSGDEGQCHQEGFSDVWDQVPGFYYD